MLKANLAHVVRTGEMVDLLHNVLESSTEYSIMANDLDGVIVLWNEGARRIFGYTADEVIGKVNSAVLHTAEDVKAGRPEALRAEALLHGKWEGSIDRVRNDGQRFTARSIITPRFDAAGHVAGLLFISKNISGEIALTQELQEKNIELEKASKAKDRFLASMSHELRTPLNAIIGFTGTLLMKLAGPLTADQDNQLQTVRSSARHLLSLINDLLDLAKIESGEVVLNLEPVSCRAVVHEVVTSLEPQARVKGLSLDVVMPNEDLTVPTDHRALRQILINLTNNAIKFTENGFVRIELKTLSNPEAVEVAITDSGIGITAEQQRKLFQAFEQARDGARAYFEGSGLGLYLSQKLAVLLGSEIVCRTEYGSGSRFSLVLRREPCVPESL